MELKLEKVGKRYGKEWALKDVDLSARSGEIVLLLGQNSAGKSTLLRILGTVIKPSVGVYTADGIDVVKNPNFLRGRISFIPEDPPLIPELSVDENLEFYSKLYGYRENFYPLKKRFGIIFSDKPVRFLSKGMKQRLSLAVSQMVRNIALFLMDEPTNELDLETVQITKDLIKEMSSKGAVVFIASHDEDLVSVSSRVVVIENGEKVFDSDVESVLKRRFVEIETGGKRVYVLPSELPSFDDYRVVRVVGIRESLSVSSEKRR